MAAFTTSDVLTRAGDILQDTGSVRWTEAKRKRYLLDGMVKIAHVVPEHGPVGFVTAALSEGIEQSITTNGAGRTVSRVLDVSWNQSGSTRGRAIRKIAKDQMDEQEPYWATADASHEVLYWMPHENAGTSYYVQPPASASASVRAKVALVPNSADTIEVSDAARDALLAYVVARCWSEDSTYAKGSAEYMAMFDAELKLLMGADTRNFQQTHKRQEPR